MSTMSTMTERRRRQLAAVEAAAQRRGGVVYRYHYVCDDGGTFSAIAASESAARCVLNAERPGMGARPDGRTHCPIETRAASLYPTPRRFGG